MLFKDYFSQQSAEYVIYRPGYPRVLFEYLAALAPQQHIAWDCATGNGQAALELAKYFVRVFASDASQAQIEHAFYHPKIKYRLASAECSNLPDNSIDLITVAQAMHWFDFDKSYEEMRRVLVPGGIVAIFAYPLLKTSDGAVNEVIEKFYHDILWQGGYWPMERAHLDNAYADIPFPFIQIKAPVFTMSTCWDMFELLNYLETWSAVQRYITVNGENIIRKHMEPEIRAVWGEPLTAKTFSVPLILRLGKV